MSEKIKPKNKCYLAIDLYTLAPLVFHNWPDTSRYVQSHPGISYHGFPNQNCLNRYQNIINSSMLAESHMMERDVTYAFVDGSYNAHSGKYGAGVVVVRNNVVMHEWCNGWGDELSKHHQIVGELNAARYAVRWAEENSIDSLVIVYDYAGVSYYALGLWDCVSEYQIDYRQFMMEESSHIDIRYMKVKSHIKNGAKSIMHEFNDLADAQAKIGAQ